MPTFNSIVESFGDPSPAIFSVLDAVSGFLQLPVSTESSKLLGIESDSKTYVMRRVPFGLVTSPAILVSKGSNMVVSLLHHFLGKYAAGVTQITLNADNWSQQE